MVMGGRVNEATDLATLKSAIANNEVCVVDFTVKWSPACVTMEEKLQDIARDFSSFHFIKMDLDVDDEILYNMDIKALPTIMVFKNAKGVGRIEGLREPVVRDVLSKLQ